MSKHKHAKQEHQKAPTKTNALKPHQEDHQTAKSEKCTHACSNDEPQRFWGMTRFEWTISILTGIAALVAGLTAAILWKQIIGMRIDQRAWISTHRQVDAPNVVTSGRSRPSRVEQACVQGDHLNPGFSPRGTGTHYLTHRLIIIHVIPARRLPPVFRNQVPRLLCILFPHQDNHSPQARKRLLQKAGRRQVAFNVRGIEQSLHHQSLRFLLAVKYLNQLFIRIRLASFFRLQIRAALP